MRTLKRAMVEHSVLGDFIRLVDYMAAEHLFKNCIHSLETFLEFLRLPQEKKVITFQITISFAGDEGLSFVPSQSNVLDTYSDLCEQMVQALAHVTRLIWLKPLKVPVLAPHAAAALPADRHPNVARCGSQGTAVHQDISYFIPPARRTA